MPLVSVSDVKDIVEIAEKLFTIAAIIAGGSWAYFNLFRGRTYRPRLEPTLTARISADSSGECLLVTSRLKNVGLSKVSIEQKGSALQIFSSTRNQSAHAPTWNGIGTYVVFGEHAWLEPGETIEDQHLVFLGPAENVAHRAVLRIVSKGCSWEAAAIAMPGPDQGTSFLGVEAGPDLGGLVVGKRQKEEDKGKTKVIESEKEQTKVGNKEDAYKKKDDRNRPS